MNPILMKLTIDYLAFLALSSDETVNQDAACDHIEHISYELKQLAPEDLSTFLSFCEAQAAECRRSGQDRDRASFLDSLPEDLGLK